MYELRETEVLVNTTPVGMFPDNDGCPADPSRFPALRGVLDVVFNPQTTELVRRARAAGLPASGGLPMLVMQAVRAHELFFGRPVEPQTAARVLETILGERRSYVLIGMPGCGKTTVGKLLAALCGRRFCDLDAEIAHRSGLSAAEWIQTRGEAAFRAYEIEVCAALAAESGLVIACGGGTVTREENMWRLARNGVLVYLTRPLEAFATEERPLSAGGVAALYEARRPLYEAYADITVANDGDRRRPPAPSWRGCRTERRRPDADRRAQRTQPQPARRARAGRVRQRRLRLARPHRQRLRFAGRSGGYRRADQFRGRAGRHDPALPWPRRRHRHQPRRLHAYERRRARRAQGRRAARSRGASLRRVGARGLPAGLLRGPSVRADLRGAGLCGLSARH